MKYISEISTMKIPLSQFELYISPPTLSKGLDYFEKGKIEEVERIESGHFSFTVIEKERYVVDIHLQGTNVINVSCNCIAHTSQELCKHITACFFYLIQSQLGQVVRKKPSKNKLESNQKAIVEPKKKKTSKSGKTIQGQVMALLEPLAESELKNIICEIAKKDKLFRAILFTRYSLLNEEISIDKYKKDVAAIIKIARGGNRRNDWWAASNIIPPLSHLLNQAQESEAKGDQNSALYLSLALVSEIMPVFDYSDDSSGRLSDLWIQALGLATDILELSPESLRLGFVKFACKECFKGFGFDFGDILLNSAIHFALSDEEYSIIKKTLLKIREKAEHEHLRDKTFFWEYNLTVAFDDETVGLQFAFENRHVRELRNIVLQELKQKNDWPAFLKIAQEGAQVYRIDKGERWYRGNWDNEVKFALEKLGDTKTLFTMYLEETITRGFTLDAWKKLESDAGLEWDQLKPQLLEKLNQGKPTQNLERLEIWMYEKEEKKIISWVRQHPYPVFIDLFPDFLKKHDPNLYKKRHFEVIDLVRNSRYYSNAEPYEKALIHLNIIRDLMTKEEIQIYFNDVEKLNSNKKVYQKILRPALLEMIQSKEREEN